MERDTKSSGSGLLGLMGGPSRWFIAELLVIIAGVLIALAIDEWREVIADANLEREYMRQLVVDLRSTEEQMAAATKGIVAYDMAAKKLVSAFESGELLEIATIRQYLADIALMDNPVPVLATADALVATGDLRLIRDPLIRSEITLYLSRARDYWLVPLYQREERHRHMYLQVTILAEKHGISPSHREGFFNRRAGPDGKPDVAGFLGNSEAYSYVARLAESKAILAGFRASMADEAASLRSRLEPLVRSE